MAARAQAAPKVCCSSSGQLAHPLPPASWASWERCCKQGGPGPVPWNPRSLQKIDWGICEPPLPTMPPAWKGCGKAWPHSQRTLLTPDLSSPLWPGRAPKKQGQVVGRAEVPCRYCTSLNPLQPLLPSPLHTCGTHCSPWLDGTLCPLTVECLGTISVTWAQLPPLDLQLTLSPQYRDKPGKAGLEFESTQHRA